MKLISTMKAQVKGLGSQFLDDILQAMDRIKAHPDAWPPFWKERNKSDSYPETLIKLIPTHQIIITAFWDNRQDPKKLLDILKNSNR